MLAGVAGGIARYLNADVTLVRVGIAALTLLSGAGAVLYLAAWLLIPRGRRRPVGRRGVDRRPPGLLPLTPTRKQPDLNETDHPCPPSSPLPLSSSSP